MKKAQGLALRTVIVSILLLLVLAILIVIFTGKIGFFSKNIEECPVKGSLCVKEKDKCPAGTAPVPRKCPLGKDVGNYCCIPIS